MAAGDLITHSGSTWMVYAETPTKSRVVRNSPSGGRPTIRTIPHAELVAPSRVPAGSERARSFARSLTEVSGVSGGRYTRALAANAATGGPTAAAATLERARAGVARATRPRAPRNDPARVAAGVARATRSAAPASGASTGNS